ncbi:MAG: 50S ribosomal protein L17 [Limisphaerales bacterium]
MRHLKRTAKLGRTSEHRNAMLANLVCSLITHRRVTTTLARARAARPVAEKMVTLGKKGAIHHRRLAVARLHQEEAARILFKEIAPAFKDRNGGYTRIVKLNQRNGDAAQRAILEWVNEILPAPAAETPAAAAEPAPAETETRPAEGQAAQTESPEAASGNQP